MCFSFGFSKPPKWWLRWRSAKTGCGALNPLALAVAKATASSLYRETPSVFFEGLTALSRRLFYARQLFEALGGSS